MFDDEVVHVLRLEGEGQFIDGGLDILFLDDRLERDVTKEGELLAHLMGHRLLGAANEDVRLDADFAEFRDGLLARLGFEFTGGLEVGQEGAMQEEDVFAARFEGKLPHRFEEGEPFDIADRPAQFRD